MDLSVFLLFSSWQSCAPPAKAAQWSGGCGLFFHDFCIFNQKFGQTTSDGLVRDLVMTLIYTAILSLPLNQVGQLSVSGESMYTKIILAAG